MAMLNLFRLACMTADVELERKAARISQTFSGKVKQVPSAFTQLIAAIDFAICPSCEVVVVGSLQARDTKEMLAAIGRQFIPNKVVIFRPAGEESEIVQIAPFTRYHASIDGKATVYVCLNYV